MTKKNRTAPASSPLASASPQTSGPPASALPPAGLQPEVAAFPDPSLPAVTVNLAPAAAAKLGADEKPAAAEENAPPGWQSLGKDHKPTHVNGKQGRREKKVRW